MKGGRVELALAIVGPGLVGKALISQLEKQICQLETLGTSLKVIGIANSRHTLLAKPPHGIDLSCWQEKFTEAETTDLKLLQEAIAAHPNPVLIDCTASEAVPALYASWLESKRAHVVTPNKRLGAGPLQNYQAVFRACQAANSRFFYEATVGAGLPIISSLQGLLRTGDEIVRIEGVLSGTLSYIFNSFGPDVSFSSVVGKAKAAGYTEPDPRDDLSGMDVARKVTILARECGLQLELSDVAVQSLVPPDLETAASAEEFLSGLRQFDGNMAERASKAAGQGQKLCYVGLVDKRAGACSVQLKARLLYKVLCLPDSLDLGVRIFRTSGLVRQCCIGLEFLPICTPYPKEHAFAQLEGSDNIVAFTTARYSSQPLIIRGPGAGAEVTAAGVFSDLILLARSLGAQC